jgi:hypothetical protein
MMKKEVNAMDGNIHVHLVVANGKKKKMRKKKKKTIREITIIN